jgi:hypothetical protein
MRPPDYLGGGLVNLAAELEHRLRGDAPWTRLYPQLRDAIPAASTYVLVLFDGLGDHQLEHPHAGPLHRARRAVLDAAFSTQTTVNLSTLATGLPPSEHGMVAYLLRFPDRVVNTIWWFDLYGEPVVIDYETFLPNPNLPERLAAAGVESVVIQPAGYDGSPLSRVLFRSGTALPYDDDDAAVEIALDAAGSPGRLIFLYFPHIDAAAHAEGQQSDLYAEMMALMARRWSELTERLPADAVAVGTADHGHVDVPPEQRLHVDAPEGLILHGDNRCVWVSGDVGRAEAFARDLPARWVDRAAMAGWWGPEPPSEVAAGRLPDGALLVEDGFALHYPGNDAELVGYHGGVSPEELRIPLLVP